MTLLEAVNKVLTRLREDEVSGWNDSSYTRLVTQLVNNAKREVENAHTWASLKTLTDATVAATATSVAFSNTNERTRVIAMYNDTDDTRMYHRSRDEIIKYREYNNSHTAAPYWYAFKGHDSSGNIEFELWPTVDGTYTLTLDAIVPQGDLSTNSDRISVPPEPVVLRAVALALAERGDDQGQNFAQVMNEYQIALNDAVVQDKDNSAVDDAWITV